MLLPKVSVIIPFYNVEKYIGECLESALNQTLKEIEIICVDDGSTDNSYEIVDEYKRKNENIKIIQKENGGQSSARNVALKIAKGKYVYFLDSDDCILPTTLEDTYQKAEKEQLDIVCFNTVAIFESEEMKDEYRFYENSYIRTGDYSSVQTGQSMFAKMREKYEFFVPVWFQIFRRSLIEENHLSFYEGIIHEDNLFTVQCFMLAKKVGYIDRSYHHRRIRVGSTMTSKIDMRNVEGYLVSYAELLRFFDSHPIEEKIKMRVFDFLYGLYRNGYNKYLLLDRENEKEHVLKGGIYTEHFLDVIRIQYTEEEEFRKEINKLNQQIKELKCSYSYRVGKVFMFVPGKIKRLIQKFLKKKKGVYFWNKIPNVGDVLNEYILKELFGLHIGFQSFADADMICIGSIMDRLVKDSIIGEDDKEMQEKANVDKYINVWGTGLMRAYEKNHKLIRPCRFYALRGELTRQALSDIQGKEISCVLADPGLLASLLVEPQKKKYSVGIIPHFSHADDAMFKKMIEYYKDSVLIDVKAEPHVVLEMISQCEVVLSTSLHGLIISDSFGIPNLWCECDKSIFGGEYKFRDYYSSYGLEAVPHNLSVEPYPDLDKIKADYKISHRDVQKKQKELVNSFPYYCAPLKKLSLYFRIKK